MTSDEFQPLMVRVEAWWPGTQWDKAMIAVWFEDLQRFELVEVRQAFERLKREHVQPFAPAIGEVLRLLERDEKPTFDEAYPTIYRAAARQQLPDAHPLIVGFINRQDLARLGALPLDDPQWGDKTRRELKAAWDEHAEVSEGREIAAIAAGGQSDLARLNPVASFGTPAQIEGAK